MKVSLNWVKQFTSVDLSVEDLVAKIGAQLGEVKEVIDLGRRYQGVLAVRVVACEQHPNADRLHVCLIDDGGIATDVPRDENGYVQVVCGAPNVRQGLTVAWLPPGSTVPATVDKDPFVLEARELRGIVSNGMLASAQELALWDDHAGILEIDTDVAPGTPFASVYELNDYIIDIENKMFTHRPDCFGMLGVAREIAGIQGQSFTSPDWYAQALERIRPGNTQLPLEVRNEAGALVPRFMAVALADVTTGKSPLIMQTYLSRLGVRPISNLVDITNYLMLLTGQPLHAYDYDKLKAQSGDVPTLIARTAHDNETVALLSGKTVTVAPPTVLIATDQTAIGVGGVMGGANTEVDEHTRNIVIECATFDMYSIRKTSMKYGLFTDAVTRFNKGQSPLQNDRVLEEAVAMVQGITGGEVASRVFDVNPSLPIITELAVPADFVNLRLGLELPAAALAELLRNVEFTVSVDDDTLHLTPPFWRTDIALPEDVVEEIGRLYGFDNLPLALPTRDLTPARKNQLLEAKRQTRQWLAEAGANEVLSYSFVHGKSLKAAGQSVDEAYQLSNALSPDLQYYRLSLVPGLLEKVRPNIKAGYEQFALFELNKVHSKKAVGDDKLPLEPLHLGFVYTSNRKQTDQPAAYYEARAYLDMVASRNGVPLSYEPLETSPSAADAPFAPARSARVRIADTGLEIGVIGELRLAVLTTLKLPVTTAAFEIDLDVLSQAGRDVDYQPLPRFPKVTQDISLRVDRNVAYAAVWQGLSQALDDLRPADTAATLEPLDIYESASDVPRHYSFRYTIASYERTLLAEEVNKLLDQAAARLHDALNAERI